LAQKASVTGKAHGKKFITREVKDQDGVATVVIVRVEPNQSNGDTNQAE
jgi:hypothetical protein